MEKIVIHLEDMPDGKNYRNWGFRYDDDPISAIIFYPRNKEEFEALKTIKNECENRKYKYKSMAHACREARKLPRCDEMDPLSVPIGYGRWGYFVALAPRYRVRARWIYYVRAECGEQLKEFARVCKQGARNGDF